MISINFHVPVKPIYTSFLSAISSASHVEKEFPYIFIVSERIMKYRFDMETERELQL